jgi:hypothetical protein
MVSPRTLATLVNGGVMLMKQFVLIFERGF